MPKIAGTVSGSEAAKTMIIPYDQLEPDTLTSLIEEFVTRSGTDYGEVEISLAERVSQVRNALISGDVVILFSEHKGECNIIRKELLNT